MKKVIRNGIILRGEPATPVLSDLVIDKGMITDIVSISDAGNAEVIDAAGKLVLPGLVDIHTHFIASKNPGYLMLAAAGVTTALDTLVGDAFVSAQCVNAIDGGLNVACLYVLKPGLTVSSASPDEAELSNVMDEAIRQGAFGVKMIGAHCPLTPDAAARAIKVAAHKGIPLMFHAGTTANRDDLRGMREAIQLADNNPFILAHVNAYCNGLTLGDQQSEALEALNLLRQHPEIISESTLSELSCMGTKMKDDIPESLCVIDLLTQLGYLGTYSGLLQAIEEGKLQVSGPTGQIYDFLNKSDGLFRCRELRGKVTIGYKKHDMTKNIMVAAGCRENGGFVVNAFSTDGGIIPRNVVLAKGLTLVDAGVFTLGEFVEKSSRAGAKILGLPNKGVLECGFDADIVIVNPSTRSADTVICNGAIIYRGGNFFPAKNHFFTNRAIH